MLFGLVAQNFSRFQTVVKGLQGLNIVTVITIGSVSSKFAIVKTFLEIMLSQAKYLQLKPLHSILAILHGPFCS